MRKFVSKYAIIFVFTSSLYAAFDGASFLKQIIGSSKPYCLLRSLTCADHVRLLSPLFSNNYLMISWILLSGCDQMQKNTEKISLWRFPSIGKSPVKKCMAGVGADFVSFSIDFNTFPWNKAIVSICTGFSTSPDRPDLVMGQVYVL